MEKVIIFSDGSCYPNPGPGGYGTIVRRQDECDVDLFAGFRRTTNCRMEIMGALAGLRLIGPERCEVTVVSDAQYVVQSINNYLRNWVLRKWVKSDGSPVKNVDLWKEMVHLCHIHQVRAQWVKGHKGHRENEKCDALALRGRLDVEHHQEDLIVEHVSDEFQSMLDFSLK
jgi:ribonuclease HI